MPRRSRRLAGKEPEIDKEDLRCLYCFDTEEDGFDVFRNVVRMPCCGKLAHRACHGRWEEETIFCGHCRKELTADGVAHEIADPVRRGALHALWGRLEDPTLMQMLQVSVTYKNFNLICNIFIHCKTLVTFCYFLH